MRNTEEEAEMMIKDLATAIVVAFPVAVVLALLLTAVMR